MVNLVESLYSGALKKVQKKKVVESKTLAEATMNDIPHEIDDVVHDLAANRTRMEDLRKTWEAAHFADLTPLDAIIKGLEELTKLVYDNGALLADQLIGSKAAAEAPAEPAPAEAEPVAEPEDGKKLLTAVIPVKSEALNEDEGSEGEGSSEEGGDDDLSGEVESLEAQLGELESSVADLPLDEEKEMTLEECEAYCAQPVNLNLKKAFKKCLTSFRQNKPEGSNGEIVKIILTPRKNLKLQFDGCERNAFAYRDGDILV